WLGAGAMACAQEPGTALGGGVISLPATTAPATAAQTTPAAPEVMRLLQMLHDRDATLQDFSAKVRKQDVNVHIDDTTTRAGIVAYQKVGGVTKLGIHFDSLMGEDMPKIVLNEDLVFDGRHFIHKDPRAKTYSVQELVPPGENFNPLKLGAGPLPLPIGQDPQEILRDFVVSLETVDGKNLPAGYKTAEELAALKLDPRIKGKFSFKSAVLLVDPKLALPVRISTVAPDGNTSAITLMQVKINEGNLQVLDVAEPPANTGWTITHEVYKKEPGSK
ncbi:MAG: hypothetical protein WCI73_19315, partial [Phycisphaerae bacterium]